MRNLKLRIEDHKMIRELIGIMLDFTSKKIEV